jgi:hypothetical protein
MTPGGRGKSDGTQEVMVWAVPSRCELLLARALPCAVALSRPLTHGLSDPRGNGKSIQPAVILTIGPDPSRDTGNVDAAPVRRNRKTLWAPCQSAAERFARDLATRRVVD